MYSIKPQYGRRRAPRRIRMIVYVVTLLLGLGGSAWAIDVMIRRKSRRIMD